MIRFEEREKLFDSIVAIEIMSGMLPGVESARRRRLHSNGSSRDFISGSSLCLYANRKLQSPLSSFSLLVRITFISYFSYLFPPLCLWLMGFDVWIESGKEHGESDRPRWKSGSSSTGSQAQIRSEVCSISQNKKHTTKQKPFSILSPTNANQIKMKFILFSFSDFHYHKEKKANYPKICEDVVPLLRLIASNLCCVICFYVRDGWKIWVW